MLLYTFFTNLVVDALHPFLQVGLGGGVEKFALFPIYFEIGGFQVFARLADAAAVRGCKGDYCLAALCGCCRKALLSVSVLKFILITY